MRLGWRGFVRLTPCWTACAVGGGAHETRLARVRAPHPRRGRALRRVARMGFGGQGWCALRPGRVGRGGGGAHGTRWARLMRLTPAEPGRIWSGGAAAAAEREADVLR